MPIRDPDDRREYARKWMAARRAAFFTGKTCADCGSKTDLRLHHIDPGQKIHHTIWSWSRDRREREIAKCIILCQRCHSRRHAADPSSFGVWLRKTGKHKGLWEAQISVSGKRRWIGRFRDRNEAIAAYEAARREV